MSRTGRLCCVLLLMLCGGAAQGHRPSDAYLTLTVEQAQLHGQWEIALRDLEAAVGVDANGDGAITWAELRDAQPALEQLLKSSLQVSTDRGACPLRIEDLLVNDRLDGRYAWFTLAGHCAQPPGTLALDYRLLFDIDPTHRGILVLHAGALTQTAVFSPAQAQRSLSLRSASRWTQFADYLREGMHHIWIGTDHILFLVTLLLPCVLVRVGTQWVGVPRLRTALLDVVGVVTAFTVAHSITLSLAALDILRLSIAPVEAVIAASVLLAALNNLWPVVIGRRWLLAFGFGLIHGFGFASALSELGLPDEARLLSLLAFNAGVELGQLAIVAILLPVIFLLRQRRLYRLLVLQAGSVLVGAAAAWWMIERLTSL
ncbi:HupE/UreJ family protein [Solimonas sp. SE-A11]|uniref:HupE/UreJ family protein n=1 Tax=Solimonas sp. SE-A11 TaxID=3054954 RepID=UPI00259CDF63|nr:HupE/UreJ family protein [Solimonas sp. SE-A11]MDM4772597.1 HupE/UreJ family protein [Solimonas sp. SE-A11]